MTKYLAFDIEVCTWPEEGYDWQEIRPLGISCVSVMASDWVEPRIYYAGILSETPEARAMTLEELQLVEDCIRRERLAGKQIVGWNSLQFDMNVLSEESQHPEFYNKLALEHIDPMFNIFMNLGWRVGLDAVAKGIGISGKFKKDVSGKSAPDKWMNGTDLDKRNVLVYAKQDAKVTLEIVKFADEWGVLHWHSQKGKPYFLNTNPLMTVEECMKLPQPNNSWMSIPILKESFYSWAIE